MCIIVCFQGGNFLFLLKERCRSIQCATPQLFVFLKNEVNLFSAKL